MVFSLRRHDVARINQDLRVLWVVLVLRKLGLSLLQGVVSLLFALGALVGVVDDVNIALPLRCLDLFLQLLVLFDLFIRHDELHSPK